LHRVILLSQPTSFGDFQMSRQGQWQVAGSAPEVYERELVPAVFEPWAPIVVGLAHPSPGERVVDVACGTGVVARVAAARVGPSGSVAAVDLNPGMLRVARTVATTTRDSASIQWHEASADKLPFPSSSFDIAYCQLGLQFFADRQAALREMHRVLVPEGRLALMVWRGIGESPGFQVLAEILETNIGPAAATIMRAPFGLSDVSELRQLVEAAGFRDVEVHQRDGTVQFPSIERFVSSYIAGSPLAGHVSQANDAAREKLRADSAQVLGRHISDRGLSFPIAAHLLAAKA
jgi:ubiquinone/menaquinone biosynthesis C-methylase UbiE